MVKPKIKVFISHSHNDKIIIEYFVENILKKLLPKNINEIRCTSLEDSTILVGGNNLELFNDINNSTLFIPFISSNYHQSQFCLLEAGAAHIRNLNNKIYVFPILDEYTNYRETIYTQVVRQHAVINDLSSLKQLHSICESLKFTDMPDENDFVTELTNFVSYYNYTLRRKSSKKLTTKEVLLNTVEKSFHSESNIDFPITLFVDRREYEKFSMDVINNKGGEKLLWTLSGSPILELINHDDIASRNFLTDYDTAFNKSVFNEKFRLIIFTDKDYAKAYLDDDESFYTAIRGLNTSFFTKTNIVKRREAFERDNKEWLYFTTQENIKNWSQKENILIDFDNFDFEFAFVSKNRANKKANFGVTTGFHSGSFDKSIDRYDLKHLIMYPQEIQINLSEKLFKGNLAPLVLYKDISLQIKLFEDLKDKSSNLRKNYVVSNELNNTTIGILK